jgi:TPP-dependent 2-oxoacid decarboxylase
MQWGSIGWAVAAAFGYSVGLEADRRLVAAIGDGSFQLTAQEVSNMIRHRQEILIFVVNNRGYVIESAIHDGPYNYYKNWDYAGLIDVFNAGDGHGLGLTATTPAELADAIAPVPTKAAQSSSNAKYPTRTRALRSFRGVRKSPESMPTHPNTSRRRKINDRPTHRRAQCAR